LYAQFENERLKKRWKIFMIGMYGAFTLYLGGLFSSMIHIQAFRDIWSVISFVLVILSGLFMHYGVGKDE
jgi:ABC-type nickel/cobalt efflux system permease component RcnA